MGLPILAAYFEAQQKVYEFFGYEEDWCVIPLEDSTEYFWRIEGVQDSEDVREQYADSSVRYAETEQELETGDGNCYCDEIYTQRHLPKWVYRGDGFTMICCDPHVDGNKFLRVFDNSKERPCARVPG